jgi:hypothetical protein
MSGRAHQGFFLLQLHISQGSFRTLSMSVQVEVVDKAPPIFSRIVHPYVLRTCSTSSGDLICSKSAPRITASSSAIAVPLPCQGVIACAASLAIHTRPFTYVAGLVCSYCAKTAGLSWSSRSCTYVVSNHPQDMREQRLASIIPLATAPSKQLANAFSMYSRSIGIRLVPEVSRLTNVPMHCTVFPRIIES